MYLKLCGVKKHLNIEDYYTDDDLYIIDLIEVAEDAVTQHLHLNNLTDVGTKIPASVIQAMLLLIGNLYANREPVSYAGVYKIPLTYEYLLSPYIKY